MEKDKSNAEQAGGDGKTLTLNGVTYVKGLGVHASSDVRYSVQSGCTSLTGVVGVDDEVGANGTVVFKVWSGTTTKLYDSGVKTGSAPGTAFSVGLAGVSTLRLVVTDGGDGQAYDHGDWADLKLICGV